MASYGLGSGPILRELLGVRQGSFHIPFSPTQLGRGLGIYSGAAEGAITMITIIIVIHVYLLLITSGGLNNGPKSYWHLNPQNL